MMIPLFILPLLLVLSTPGGAADRTWRDDHRCGEDYLVVVNGKHIPATCTILPSIGYSCCSVHGWCGRSDAHCTCDKCSIFYSDEQEILSRVIVNEKIYDLDPPMGQVNCAKMVEGEEEESDMFLSGFVYEMAGEKNSGLISVICHSAVNY
eukprot:sb/3473497/